MASGLERYQKLGHLHFITFSCYQRRPYLGSPATRRLFEVEMERVRQAYRLQVIGYVVMPEHVHLLLSEPERKSLAIAVQALKVSVTRHSRQNPFWLARYYDFNVFTDAKRVEKIEYMHRNPVNRELVAAAEEWEWSSFRHYISGEQGRVRIESAWQSIGTRPDISQVR